MTDLKHRFTIITVTYNAGDQLEKTIQSVINQRYPNTEYIIVDGGSSDNTIEIIKKYENQINCWISEDDSGIYEAMNKGVELAKGDWVNFMNAGDKFTENETIAWISQQINPDSDVVFGDRYYIRNGKKTLQKARPIEEIFVRMPFGHQASFFKRELIKNNHFNDTYRYTADYELLIRLYLKGCKFQYIPIAVCDFIDGGKSESGLRPYLEALKILYDNCNDKKVIEKNAYFQSFFKNSKKLLKESIGK